MVNTQVPTLENLKSFMVFDGEPNDYTFLFDGNLRHFSTVFSPVSSWAEVEAWAKESNFTLVVAGSAKYNEMTELFQSQDFDVDTGPGIFDDDGQLFDYAESVNNRIFDDN